MFLLLIGLLFISQSFSTTDLYVGYPDKEKNFDKIQDAINEAASISPKNEQERVKIHIAPGTYRQQLKIETPYITLLNEEPEKEVKITWYYGIGYKYYSVGTDGLYNETRAKDKTEKAPAGGRWGATVHLIRWGTYFRAENIIFENSFNRYITQEEIDDGVELSMETGIRTIRNMSLDANSREATERAAAFSVEGAFCEFYNCQFLSSQDTLFTGSSPQYYKNCLIEGQTDYIFGGSNAVFDSCYLSWKGYSEGSLGGYITANLEGDAPYTGYLFYNCTVIANKNLTVRPGALGRPWRETAKVTFINTILESAELISEDGWGEMGGVNPEDVKGFWEYGTSLSDGTLVDLSKRKGNIIDNIDFSQFDLRSYMNNWTPYYFTSKSYEDSYEWDRLKIGGGGFLSGLVIGQREMYLRTDVGGAYKYDYQKKVWKQLFDFINEDKREYLSVRGIAIYPTDDDIVYFLCGNAYIPPFKSAIYKTTDGGKTFTEINISDLMEVHGNGLGRESTEPISVDPNNPKVIYAGGNVVTGGSALIKSTDGGLTWNAIKSYDNLGFFRYVIKWPTWVEYYVRGAADDAYNLQAGITFVKVIDNKVYVGTAIVGQPNIHVADIDTDEFTVLSEELPTNNYPLTIKYDDNGNIIFTYIHSLDFDGSLGGAYKYNILTKKVTDISPIRNSISVAIDRKDHNKLIARTVGSWFEQRWKEVDGEENISYGDRFYRSIDGGLSWTDITPGKLGEKDLHSYYVSRPLFENGYDWIVNNSIHWGPGLEIDPRDPDRVIVLSGNGLWVCDNVWKESDVQFYFDPNGIEKVVPIDLISIRGGYVYSTVMDYDGFIHKNLKDVGIRYNPTMGGTSTISVCRQNPDVMLRISDRNDIGYYSEDGGFTWKELDSIFGVGGGRGAITIIADEKYRFFHALSDRVLYTDNHGRDWFQSTGTLGQDINIYIEEKDPMIVYTYSNTKKDDSDKKNIQGISGDGGKTFITKVVSDYDGTDFSNRIAYLSEGKIALAAGNNGLYIVSNFGEVITKLESVVYCKSVGFGVPEQGQRDNTLFIYGKPFATDPLGAYFSSDEGKTWILINHKKLYGGTGNGNFVVGDMNTFGTVYMSSLGTGIIYGRVNKY